MQFHILHALTQNHKLPMTNGPKQNEGCSNAVPAGHYGHLSEIETKTWKHLQTQKESDSS